MKVNFTTILNDLTEKNTWKNSLRKILGLSITNSDITTINTNVTNLDTKYQKAYQTLTSALTVTMNINTSMYAKITLGHNVALTLSELTNGDEGNIIVTQGASNFTLTITPTPYVINDGAGVITLESGNGSITILSYSYDGTRLVVTVGSNYTNA
jgi:hypothetical protein